MSNICYQILTNSSMVPENLQRHLYIRARHADRKDKPLMLFKRKYEELKHSRNKWHLSVHMKKEVCVKLLTNWEGGD
jgi:hypothetical protein